MTEVLVVSDLDQTLIFSPRAAGRGPERESRVCEVLDGEVISLLSVATEEGLVALSKRAIFVPVTTRTRAQYTRIVLPVTPAFAVVASGGVVLVDGVPDPAWSDVVAARLAEHASPLAEIRELFAGWGDRPWLLRHKDADELFVVAMVEAEHLDEAHLAEVTEACVALGWRAVHQGRKLYVLPTGLDKAAAVTYVTDLAIDSRSAAERVTSDGDGGRPRVLAAGDTLLDWEMLCAADLAWMPAGSELDRLGMSAPHVTRTRESGLAAAEQIVADCLRSAAQD